MMDYQFSVELISGNATGHSINLLFWKKNLDKVGNYQLCKMWRCIFLHGYSLSLKLIICTTQKIKKIKIYPNKCWKLFYHQHWRVLYFHCLKYYHKRSFHLPTILTHIGWIYLVSSTSVTQNYSWEIYFHALFCLT